MIKGVYSQKIARKILPEIHQVIGFSRNNDDWKYDIPCGINFGDFILPRRPTIYYWIRTKGGCYYVGYAFYHWFDYTHCPPGKLFGEHRSDMEGVLIKVPKFNPDGKAPELRRRKIVTVCHRKFLKSCRYQNRIWIEFGGHGIHPGPYAGKRDCLTMRKSHNLISMDGWSKSYWKAVTDEFAKTGPKTPKGWKIGDFNMWDHPDAFFDNREVVSKIKVER